MKLKRIIVAGTITALLAGLAGTGTALVRMHGKVRALEQECAQLARKKAEEAPVAAQTQPQRKRDAKASAAAKGPGLYYEYTVKEGDDIVSVAIKFGVSPSVLMEANDLKSGDDVTAGTVIKIPCNDAHPVPEVEQALAAKSESADTNVPPAALCVVRTDYDGEETLRIRLSRRPDMEVIRHYVSVEPLQEGGLSFDYVTPYDYRKKVFEPMVIVKGDYAHRTNVTLRVRAGLPPNGKGANPNPEGALREDYTYTFQRKDRDPYVAFADGGRYLPPGGKRLLKLESVNVGRIRANVWRVEPRNVVQLLAREEGVYSRYDWDKNIDDKETAELAGDAEETKMTPPNRLNEKEFSALPVKVNDGKATNGVFLVSILNDDKPQRDYRWDDDYNPLRFRLVCLSDLGISVRSDAADGLGVWVTSLLKGTPVAGAKVEVYSTANTKVMEGVTDARGWCRAARVDKGAPFAVVVRSATGDDMTFLALRDSMKVDESYAGGAREPYLDDKKATAFCWTDRGIYRHGEKIFVHAIARTGARRAPPSMPVMLRLVNPDGNTYASVTKTTDSEGAISHDGFTVADDQPSGGWSIVAEIPGKNGRRLGEVDVKIEEFAPPQIRVAVEAETVPHPTNFAFTVKAEHLFGGPAQGLSCEGAVVYEDVAFAPANWKGWRFGNENLGLKPNFRELERQCLAADGSFRYEAPIWADYGLPKAAVRATAQGTVFEDGGRPATARKSAVQHYYPFYIGTTAKSSMKLEQGMRPKVAVACVAPDGSRLAEPRTLTAEIERVDTVYAYRTKPNGWQAWDCDRVNVLVASNIVITTSTNENTILELPLEKSGDYVLTIRDSASQASFGLNFYLSDWGDNVVRAPLSNPTEVTLAADKARYRAGEAPHLTVKAPFAGYALVSVMREKEVYTEVHNLTNATSELVLRPVTADQAPNLDVYVSVVQSVAANARHLAARAHGQTTVAIRPEENEVPVAVDAKVVGFREVDVEVAAPRATVAVVTVVDEAINLLCGGETPDPVGYFSQKRCAEHPLHDLYHRILPVVGEDELRVRGVKTGGGFGAEMLGRVSPVPTRRFKPLALWSGRVPVVDGKARTTFKLPEFVGEVRVTAVAYSASAAGAASVQRKVTPKLVTMPDAPRFVAPGDVFEATLPIHNRSGAAATFDCTIATNGAAALSASAVALAKDASTNVVVRLVAPKDPGELEIAYRVDGMGESHEKTIQLPVRPAVAWVETAGVVPESEWKPPAGGRFSARTFDSPIGELERALGWLADYPHGCLEQTSSRIFPLVGASGILNTVTPKGPEYIAAGVKRVESMIRKNDFVMWPDCTYAPWDREVSLYAAHFLVEAGKSGVALNPVAREQVIGFLRKWAASANAEHAAYACHTLALAGVPDRGRMLSLYDARTKLSLLARARLARAFALASDRSRALDLLANASAPASVKEAAFALIALLELGAEDARVLPLVEFLNSKRERAKYSWGTTGENAHALLALGEFYRYHPPKKGEKFVSWRKLELPDPRDVRDESNGIGIERRFFDAEGQPADLGALRRGQMLIAELTLTVDDTRVLNDLVVEDLFAGAFEPVHGALPASFALPPGDRAIPQAEWVMRSDARDDRMLVFSKKFKLEKGREAKFRYPVRVVSAGDFVLPGPSVEGMYHPALRARRIPGRIVVRD